VASQTIRSRKGNHGQGGRRDGGEGFVGFLSRKLAGGTKAERFSKKKTSAVLDSLRNRGDEGHALPKKKKRRKTFFPYYQWQRGKKGGQKNTQRRGSGDEKKKPAGKESQLM